ncbi:MAG: protein translocase subunit SecD [Sneathiellaceae bacterium]
MKQSNWRLAACALIALLGILLALPSLLPRSALEHWPDWLPQRALVLGLDLRGGSYLVLQIDDAALRAGLRDEAAALARETLRGGGIRSAIDLAGPGRAILTLERQDDMALARQTLAQLFAGDGHGVAVTLAGPAALHIDLAGEGLAARRASALAQSLEILRRRLDEVGVAEPSLQRVGSDRIMVQLPGVQDPKGLRDLLGSTAKLSFHRGDLLPPSATPPVGRKAMRGMQGDARYAVEPRAVLQGERLRDATAGFDQQHGEPVVDFRFDQAGARRFAALTQKMVGRPLLIVLDGKVVSAPVVREPILDGSGRISGGFSFRESAQLAALLRAGALPVPLTVVEERSLGAELGEDAVAAGTWSGLGGFLLVCLAMAGLYGVWGIVANLALALNVLLTVGALALLGATLTLPGIAGIILGIGLAVDANVLINERIREETRRGRSAVAALQAGFSRAYRTIVDSNVTTLLAMAMLFWFGSGPVRGFAVTMGIGIGISMFTAVTVVMALMAAHLRLRRPRSFRIRGLLPQPAWLVAPHIRFMRGRVAGLAISLLLSLGSLALLAAPGLNYGIDFRGGVLIEAHSPTAIDLPGIRATLHGLQLGDVSVQRFGDDRSLLLRVEMQPGGEAAQTAAADRARTALAEAAPGLRMDRVEVVGPRVSAELATSGMLALLGAAIVVFGYIWLRFEWPFAIAAVVTLVLDVTKTVGFVALTGLDFGLTAIVALLTLIGYSVNDKVVVFDRMRENLRLYKAMPLREVIDLSINQTLARSLYTSLTALLALAPLAIWGGAAVRSFAIPMVFGILVAASSSVFIAAPILSWLGDWRRGRAGAPPALPVTAQAEAGNPAGAASNP